MQQRQSERLLKHELTYRLTDRIMYEGQVERRIGQLAVDSEKCARARSHMCWRMYVYIAVYTHTHTHTLA